DYFNAKLSIFEQTKRALINLDSDHAETILQAAKKQHCETVLFTMNKEKKHLAHYCIDNLVEHEGVLSFDIIHNNTSHPITLSMPGAFNAANALAAAACAYEEGISWSSIQKGLSCTHVPGRMQLFVSDDSKMIILVDNAHNEMSFHAFFQAVKLAYPTRKILASFGAAGDKSHERRKVLPEVASKYAQYLIFTEDDAGHMPFDELCAEMGAHTHGIAWEAVFERKDAAARAAEIVAGDEASWIICLLAKGTDTAQHRGDDTVFVQHDVDSAQQLINTYNTTHGRA
ncbi:MAG: UDP-N-acetylmuramyl peptide synthase, partial [Eggerthellaceae bacterium]|nr:UDP-N-acetylmuramyl peptide synthase [Eggerthellaceae bacterium]